MSDSLDFGTFGTYGLPSGNVGGFGILGRGYNAPLEQLASGTSVDAPHMLLRDISGVSYIPIERNLTRPRHLLPFTTPTPPTQPRVQPPLVVPEPEPEINRLAEIVEATNILYREAIAVAAATPEGGHVAAPPTQTRGERYSGAGRRPAFADTSDEARQRRDERGFEMFGTDYNPRAHRHLVGDAAETLAAYRRNL